MLSPGTLFDCYHRATRRETRADGTVTVEFAKRLLDSLGVWEAHCLASGKALGLDLPLSEELGTPSEEIDFVESEAYVTAMLAVRERLEQDGRETGAAKA